MEDRQAKPSPRSRVQEMAKFAWECAQRCIDKENFVQLAKSAPALIMANGLMQALAYWESRGKEGGKHLVKIVSFWLTRQKEEDLFKTVMNRLNQMGSSEYAAATREALELLKWVKQFASALQGEAEK